MKKSIELKERRGLLDTELTSLNAKVEAREALTPAEELRFSEVIAEIETLSSDIDKEEKREKAIEDAEKRSKGGVAAYVKGGSTDNEEQMKSVFSYRSFILDAAESQGRMTGINAEIHQEGKREMISSNITPKGQVIPAFILAGEERALTTSTADTAKAGYLIQTEKLGGEYIDLLRNAVVSVKAGAQFMGGLVGNIDIPKLVTSAGGAWLTETGAITAADNVHGQLSGSPKRYGNATPISKTLLRQTTMDAERIVRNDLIRTHAVAVDTASLIGSGSSNQPTGISATAGIGSYALGTNGLAPTWAMAVGLETEVANDNAMQGSLCYVTNSKVRGKMKTVLKDAGSGLYLWDNGDYLNGYKVYVSNSMPSTLTKGSSSGVCSSMYFGNFNDLMILQWGGIDLVIDGVTLAKSNQIEVVANGYYDIIVRRAESFAACLDILTT